MAKLAIKPTLAKLVDELGDINEKIAKLKPRMEELKELMKSYGPGVYDGKEYVVTNEQGKTTFYKNALLEEHISEALLEKCKVTTAYLKVTTHRRQAKLRVLK